MRNYTKEPWKAEQDFYDESWQITIKDSAVCHLFYLEEARYIRDLEHAEANAKRIVECVNECAGLTEDEIKEAVRSFKYLKGIQS